MMTLSAAATAVSDLSTHLPKVANSKPEFGRLICTNSSFEKPPSGPTKIAAGSLLLEFEPFVLFRLNKRDNRLLASIPALGSQQVYIGPFMARILDSPFVTSAI